MTGPQILWALNPWSLQQVWGRFLEPKTLRVWFWNSTTEEAGVLQGKNKLVRGASKNQSAICEIFDDAIS